MILPPNVRTEQVVQRRDRPAPGNVVAHLQPLGVLVEHRVDDVDERFVAREEPMPAGQQVSLQPALALVFAEHLHHPAVRRQVVVFRVDVGHVAAVGHLQHVLPTVRVVFVGAEQAQVPAVQVLLHDVPEKPAHLAGRFGVGCPWAGHFDGIVAEVRHLQVSEQQAAVGVRVVAHPSVALRSQFGQFGLEPPLRVEQLFGPVALHPLFEDANVLGLVHVAHRHLVRAASSPRTSCRRSPADRSSPSACGRRSSARPVASRRPWYGRQPRSA